MARGRASEVDGDGQPVWRMWMFGALVLVQCDPRQAPEVVPEVAPRAGYAPATVGDTWVYQTSQSHPGAGVPLATSSERIVSVAQDGARRVARVVTADAHNAAAGSERSLVLTPGGVSPDIGTMTTVIGPVRAVKTGGVFLPAELPPGLRWTWSQELETPVSSMSVAARAEVVGVEWVAVPAGRFEAVVVASELTNRLVTKDVAPIDHVQRDRSWWVRGLGLVKAVTEGGSGYASVKELVKYSVAGAPAPVVDAPQIAAPR